MAWLTTDWENELNQVQDRINLILDEKVEPLLDRTVEKATADITTVVAKAEFELRDNTNHFLAELAAHRQQMVADMKGVIRYAAVAAFLVVAASVLLIKLVGLL
ncbi:MAG TPA: hypothetical protein VLE50_10530 [Cellvibrio sp.]|nr:hypothetical protein [Cellvibrio sp.]